MLLEVGDADEFYVLEVGVDFEDLEGRLKGALHWRHEYNIYVREVLEGVLLAFQSLLEAYVAQWSVQKGRIMFC